MRRLMGALTAAAIVPSVLVMMAGCKNADKSSGNQNSSDHAAASATDPARGLAAVDKDVEQQEKEFQILLNEEDIPGKLKTTYLERLLRIYYRAEVYVEEFEANLDETLIKQKKDPNFKADPLDTAVYRKLTGQFMLSHRLTHDIEFYYRRLLETAKSQVVSEQSRNRATAALEAMNTWVSSLAEEDKLQLVDLFDRLDEVKKAFDTASNTAGAPGRSVASISDFTTYAKMDSAELERRHKKHKKKIRAKAAASKNWHDAESDGDFAWLQFEKTERLPSSAKIYPSAGPDGNVIGRAFPAGTYVLTFDDGPGGKSTPRLLPILKARNTPATFFQLAKQVQALPGVVDTMKSQFGGHLNNHSWTHANFAKSSQAQLNHEIVDSTAALRRAYGQNFEFFRCPYGACFAPKIPVVREMIANLGLIHAYWTIDSLDWKNIGQPQRTLALIKKQMQAVGRGIILMHDIHESSVDAAKLLLDDQGNKVKWLDLETAVANYNRAQ